MEFPKGHVIKKLEEALGEELEKAKSQSNQCLEGSKYAKFVVVYEEGIRTSLNIVHNTAKKHYKSKIGQKREIRRREICSL